MVTANNLHLESLEIESFRGIDKLTIPRLGRVTLLAGKNGVGKTTVLEALRVYAARGHYAVMADILKIATKSSSHSITRMRNSSFPIGQPSFTAGRSRRTLASPSVQSSAQSRASG